MSDSSSKSVKAAPDVKNIMCNACGQIRREGEVCTCRNAENASESEGLTEKDIPPPIPSEGSGPKIPENNLSGKESEDTSLNFSPSVKAGEDTGEKNKNRVSENPQKVSDSTGPLFSSDSIDADKSADNSGAEGGGEPGPGFILGKYRIIREIGEGGMGKVFLAEHIMLGRKVAIKLLHPEQAKVPEVVNRFFAEARAVNRIEDSHIVEITDFVDEQFSYYVMEYLEGEDLADLLEDNGPLPIERVVEIAIQVAGALAKTHQAGIIHRDLKPANVFITQRDGKDYVKLLDFGIAKMKGSDKEPNLKLTAAGTVVGTPEYMAPEQATAGELDQRTDIYAMGLVIFASVTGRPPFTASSYGEMLVKHITVRPPAPSSLVEALDASIPESLERLILECLEKKKEDRPASMEIVRDRLENIRKEIAFSEINPHVPEESGEPGASEGFQLCSGEKDHAGDEGLSAPDYSDDESTDKFRKPSVRDLDADGFIHKIRGKRRITRGILAFGIIAAIFVVYIVIRPDTVDQHEELRLADKTKAGESTVPMNAGVLSEGSSDSLHDALSDLQADDQMEISERKEEIDVSPGMIMIISQIQGARVYVNDKFAGTVPVSIQPDTFDILSVKVDASGRIPFEMDIEPDSNDIEVVARLEPSSEPARPDRIKTLERRKSSDLRKGKGTKEKKSTDEDTKSIPEFIPIEF